MASSQHVPQPAPNGPSGVRFIRVSGLPRTITPVYAPAAPSPSPSVEGDTPLSRTSTWDQPPLGVPFLNRTSTWDRPAPTAGGPPIMVSTPGSDSGASSFFRTSTWDRPPIDGASFVTPSRTTSASSSSNGTFFSIDRTPTWERPPRTTSALGTVSEDEGDQAHHSSLQRAPTALAAVAEGSALPAAVAGAAGAVPAAGVRVVVLKRTPTQLWPTASTNQPQAGFIGDNKATSAPAVFKQSQASPNLVKVPSSGPLTRSSTVRLAPVQPSSPGQAATEAPPTIRVIQRAHTLDLGAAATLQGAAPGPPSATLQASTSAPAQAQGEAPAQRQLQLQQQQQQQLQQQQQQQQAKPVHVPAPSPPLAAPVPATPEDVSEMGRRLLAAAIGCRGKQFAPEKFQLRIIIAGLMGSGKSTLCRMLKSLLGGVWVNQDEFSHLKKKAKHAFLDEIRKQAADPNVSVLLVDKINTMRQHRREIREAMQENKNKGKIVFVQYAHPDDPPDQWNQAVRLCESRIRNRGQGHRTLMGTEPKLGAILRSTAQGIEPLGEDEQSEFATVLWVDMTQDPVHIARQVLQGLEGHDLLMDFDVEALSTDESLQKAQESSYELEATLASKPGAARPSPSGKPHSPPKTPKQRGPWLWSLELDEESSNLVRSTWESFRERMPNPMNLNTTFHITLLYIGGGSDEEIAKRHPGLEVEGVRKLKDDLANREGSELQVSTELFAWDPRIATIKVVLSEGLSANRHPHVTVATAEKIQPRVSNELLGRLEATDNLERGLGPWLSEMGLGKHSKALLEWCVAMGAATPDEIAENAVDAAAAMENETAAEQERIAKILERAAPGQLCAEPLRLTLKGVVRKS